MSPRPPAAATLLRAALLGLGAACALVPACSTPSADIDGGDLMGVFSHDAGADADASADAGHRHHKHKDAAADAPAPADPAPSAAPSASVRAPVEGVCVTPDGQPDHELRRTIGRPP